MLKAIIILSISFSIWYGLVKIFSTNEESSIDDLSKRVFNNINLVFKNILHVLDSLLKSFIQIYELLGLIFKNMVDILKSLSATFGQFIMFFKVIGLTLISILSLCKALYRETKNITLLNSFDVLLNQRKFEKNNIVRLLKFKGDDFNNKEVSLER